jgi:hypothetical protein
MQLRFELVGGRLRVNGIIVVPRIVGAALQGNGSMREIIGSNKAVHEQHNTNAKNFPKHGSK